MAEPALTFAKALEIAQAAKAADRHARELDRTVPTAGVNKVSPVPRSQKGGGTYRPTMTSCYRCGGKHQSDKCRYKDVDCHHCGKKGHLAKVCRSKQRAQPGKPLQYHASKQTVQDTHLVMDKDTEGATYNLFALEAVQTPAPLRVTMQVNKAKLTMEVDTGASASIISNETYIRLWQRPLLQASQCKLRTYTGEVLEVRGILTVDVTYADQTRTLPLLVVAGNGPSLLGRDWLLQIRLDWQSLNNLQPATPTNLETVLSRHTEGFREELGLVKGVAAKLHVDPKIPPRFCKPRTVPFALRDKVNKELERLEKAGVIEPVQFSDWAAPIVPVLKQDGSMRICGDYKVTVNRAAKVDSFPLPRIDDLFASLHGRRENILQA